MGSGAILPLAELGASLVKTIIITSNSTPNATVSPGVRGPWTPPQYSEQATTVMSVPNTSTSDTGVTSTTSTIYVFDAVFRLLHRGSLRKTQHPVLTGANISDHAYAEPSKLILEIGMSDAMSSFTSGVWVGFGTKSVSAWQILKQLRVSKTLVTLSTRLDTYYNMLITDVSSPDDNKTKFALRASVTFEEVIAASVASQSSDGSRPQTTGSTPSGTVQSVSPNPQQINQNVIPSTEFPDTPTYPNVPGAGSVSSNTLGTVPKES